MRRMQRSRAVLGLLAVGALLGACSSAQDIGAQRGPVAPAPHPIAPPTARHTSQPTTPAPSTATTPPPPAAHSGFGEGPPGHGLARFYDQQVSWTPCGGSYKCASIWVPLDYAHPDGTAITIKAKMSPSGDPGHANGTLFINPGGPGASGIDYLDYADFGPAVTSQFAVVGFDPRGVGQSTPVDCVSDRALDAYVQRRPVAGHSCRRSRPSSASGSTSPTAACASPGRCSLTCRRSRRRATWTSCVRW